MDDYDHFSRRHLDARFVKVVCPSTGKSTFLRVDVSVPQTSTPLGAIAWTFGMTENEYKPIFEA